MEFHISRQSRDRYQFDQSLFTFSGNVIFANFHAVRLFVQKVNQKKDLVNFPEKGWKAGQVNAMGLIDEILHYVVDLYRQQKNPIVMVNALDWLESHIGKENLDKALVYFTMEFPPVAVYRKELSIQDYLDGTTDGKSNRAIALEEMLMLWVANKNPALTPYLELFDDDHLETETAYLKIMNELHNFFDTQPRFGPEQQNLVDMLRAPAIAVPYSLTGQLEFIRTRWAELLGRYLYRLLSSLDLIKEEESFRILGVGGKVPVPSYWGVEFEPERFSPDKEWMPRSVIIAKNTYVWMDQLSKKYKREIHHLDEIPSEELDLLARWGFSGLWLIGLWERSAASAHIKQLCGNQEAISSAYSLANYAIAWDLGGEEAYNSLRDRAWQRGIRLASDMVPNHMGIDSQWVTDHPDWFISLDYSPFPSYTFNGPDLSHDPRVGIYIEDHYFSRSDASVVFMLVDRQSGQTRFIYHGNDGTSMPWNDTAQLNYLIPEVREAVIQTILSVARKFPIIRFDAAMTLAKKHYQRLWYPEPGSGGAIPTRAEHGMTKDAFDAVFPIEFWREVVDRVAKEAPDTLLLAEAFWLMEGYFVRTLGMHRVYNSAFMNMLRNEDNASYRLVMKNTLEFDPEIMKRFVNFMNNPDERTAVDQFGKGDKYFGICTMMATLPGLPMFGHGQIEGYTEKYGMEFRRAYWDEYPDPYLVERHEKEIFPLLHRRSLFAGVENFLLYDFFTPEGFVNEDVYAYSNGVGNERGLVIFNNKFSSTHGWVRNSAGFSVKTGSGDQRQITQRTLGEGLNIQPATDSFVIFRDHTSGLEFIRPSVEISEKGLFVELEAYKFNVFLDFRQITDDVYQSYRNLCDRLNGRGVPNIQDALRELLLQPVQNPFREISNPGYFKYLLSQRLDGKITSVPEPLLTEASQKMESLLQGIQALTGLSENQSEVLDHLSGSLTTALSLNKLETLSMLPSGKKSKAALDYLKTGLKNNDRHWLMLFAWLFVHDLGRLASDTGYDYQSQSWMDEWQFSKIMAGAFQSINATDEPAAWWMVGSIRMLVGQQNWAMSCAGKSDKEILESWLSEEEVQRFLNVNRYKDILWFNKESFEEFLWWMDLLVLFKVNEDASLTDTQKVEQILGTHEVVQRLIKAASVSEFQLDKLLAAAED
ncbi:MAG: alpha-amylase family glycosyl hydrolase [Anaerolineaceae bacterium]|nr:alpha-amylase family glycosyl hydrolase [Anaerolineaceae bacterium]